MDEPNMSTIPHIDEYARKRGVCYLGETGTGVTYALQMQMKADIEANKRLLLIDPYGDLTNSLLEMRNELKIWRLGEKESPFYIDLFASDKNKDNFQIADEIIDFLYMLFDPQRTGIIGPRFEHTIRNVSVALLDAGQGSFINIIRMLTDNDYLQSILPSVRHESVRIYFNDQLKRTSDLQKSEVFEYIISKLSIFAESNSFISNVFNGTERESFTNIISNTKQTIGIDLSLLRKQPIHLQQIINHLLLKTLTNLIKDKNENIMNMSFYIDEADKLDHNLLNEIITYSRRQMANVVYTARSISLASIEAQYSYLAGKTIVAYRVSPPDAKILEQYFDGFKKYLDLSSQQNFHFMMRLRTSEGIKLFES